MTFIRFLFREPCRKDELLLLFKEETETLMEQSNGSPDQQSLWNLKLRILVNVCHILLHSSEKGNGCWVKVY